MHARSIKLAFLSGIAAAALAGCGGGSGNGGEVTMQPGRYEMSATVKEIRVPGAPEGTAEAMSEAVKQVQSACLKPEDVNNPGDKLAPRQNPGDACSENTFNWKAGRIEGKMRCASDKGPLSADIVGTYSRDSFTFDIDTDVPNMADADGERGRIAMRSEGRRVGECNGTEGPK